MMDAFEASLFVKALAVNVRVEAMKAANANAAFQQKPIPWQQSDFEEQAGELDHLAHLLRTN